jgi:hypothetical protein
MKPDRHLQAAEADRRNARLALSGPTWFCLLQHLPAVDRDVLAGNPMGERRAQEQGDLRHLVGPAAAAERDAAQKAA